MSAFYHGVDRPERREHRADPVERQHDRAVRWRIVGIIMRFGKDGGDAGRHRAAREKRRIVALATRC